MNNLKVVIMGLGYIGLPTAALIASKDIKVHGVDVNQDIVDTINMGNVHIIEPDLEGLVKYSVENKLFSANLEPIKADIFLIAVPTPFKDEHIPDISYVKTSIDMVIPYLESNNLIIIESTCPVGTTDEMKDFIFNKRPELRDEIFLSYCPERVLPGKIIFELENNDRVIGGIDKNSSEKAFDFYSMFVKGKLHSTNARTAEMCKLVENSYRDVSIAFANELSMICDEAKINVWELIELANKHPRVSILKPGSGVGGHCIAVDPWFIVNDFKEHARLIKTSREVNTFKTEWIIQKIKEEAKAFEVKNKKNPSIACLGLSYKADIDDLRESPALYIAKILINEGYNILPVEPNIKESNDIKLYDYKTAVSDADILVFLVSHKQFKSLLIRDKIVLDFCNLNNS
jgi:UDP-N-acetyl-D-mannosaminuronic acid dehydrogenase